MKRLIFIAVLGYVTFSAPAGATNGMRLTGFGPVQNSMGGVGVGATLDSCSGLTNPAGLVDLGPRVDVGGQYFKPTVDYHGVEAPLPPSFTGAVIAQPNVQLGSTRGGSPIPAVAGIARLGPDIAFGIGAFGVSGMGVDYPQNLYGGITTTSYLLARVAPAISWRANDLIAVGLSLNLMAAQVKWNVASGFGQQLHDTSTAPGIGGTIGVKITPNRMLSIGVAWESRSYFRDFSFDIPAHTGVDPATFQPVSIPAGQDKLSFDQPMVATVGATVTPLDELLVAADVEWINWADTNGANKPAYSTNPQATGAMPWNLDWRNQWVFKLGAQVTPMPRLRIRAGYNYGMMPLRSGRAFENIAFPAVAEHHLSAGAGYDFTDKLSMNASGMYSPKATLSGANATYPAQGGQAIQTYTTSMSQYALDLGVGYHF